jgi:hypothetical protein
MPSFTVDFKDVQNETGLKRPDSLTKTSVASARRHALDAMAGYSSDGDYIGSTDQPGNRVAELARRKTLERSQKEANVALMPKSRPQIEWTPGRVDINFTRPEVTVDCEGELLPRMSLEPPPSVEVYFKTRPSMDVRVEQMDGFEPAYPFLDEQL